MQHRNITVTDSNSLLDLCKFKNLHNSSKTAIECYAEQGENGEEIIVKESISYEELEVASGRLRQILDLIVDTSKNVIGILMQPCIELVVCVLGILKAECVVAPLDVKATSKIFKNMIETAGMNYVIAHTCQRCTVDERFGESIIEEKNFTQFASCEKYLKNLVLYKMKSNSRNKINDNNSSDAAYIVQTSGTTGVPKIIAVPDKCIIPNIVHLSKIFQVSDTSRVAMVSPPTFDASIVEMFLALSNHAMLVIPSQAVKSSPTKLQDVLFKRARITVLQATPSLIKRFRICDLKTVVFGENSSLNVLALGGEPCPSCSFLRNWLNPEIVGGKKLRCKFFNIYGITEVSSWASLHEIPASNILLSDDSVIPLGNPLLETKLQVRDEETGLTLCTIFSNYDQYQIMTDAGCRYKLEQQNIKQLKRGDTIPPGPIKFCGKLFIGGKDRICHILNARDEEYRDTGDLVQVTIENDNILKIYFIGRYDKIVKRNGKKLNLSHLSQKICEILNIYVCHVMLIFDDEKGMQIVAFIDSSIECDQTTQNNSGLQCSRDLVFQCFMKLSQKLEPQLMPDKIIFVDILPITSHGKVDEKYLKKIYHQKSKQEFTTKTNKCIKEAVITILLSILNKFVKKFNISNYEIYLDKNLVQLGGDSFAETMFINMLELCLEISLFQVIPNIMELLHNHNLRDFIKILTNKFKTHEQELYLHPKSKRQKKSISILPNCKNMCNMSSLIVVGYGRGGQKYHASPNRSSTLKKVDESASSIEDCDSKSDLQIVWKYNTSKCIDASPLVSFYNSTEGICFIGSHSHMFSAVSLKTGEMLWNQMLPDRIESSACLAVVNEKEVICVGCNDGHVYFFDALNGKILWKFQTGSQVKSSLCWLEERYEVYVGSHDGFLYSLDVATQQCKWKHYCGGGAVFSSPMLYKMSEEPSTCTVIVATLQGNILSLSAIDGKINWTTSVGKPVFSSPCVIEQGICIGCVDCNVYLLDHSTGSELWRYKTGQPIFSSPCQSVDGKFLFIGSHDGHLYNLNPSDGSCVWNVETTDKSPVYSTPFTINFQDGYKDVVVFASTSGEVYVVDQQNGDVIVKKVLPAEIFSSPVVLCDSIISANKPSCRIVIGCRDDNLYCLQYSL